MTRSQEAPPPEGGRPQPRDGGPPGPSPDRLAGMTDEGCAALARTGNRPAQEELVSRYTSRIFNLLARTLGDRGLAADGTQEVFLRLFREIRSFDPRRSFRTWILSIAWNLTRDLIRRREVRHRTGMTSLASGAGVDGEPMPEPADPRAQEPAEVLEAKERSELVRSALGGLEPRQRALLILRDFEGLSYEEIARLSAIPVGTIKSGIHRARLELKDAFLRLDPEWGHGL
jgi:RNA polymerase sigma-70 factor, ECF subfamily